MTKTSENEKERIRKVAHLLYEGARRVRILRSIDWPISVKQDFFAKGARELPEISYPGFDATPTIEIVREARRMIVPITPIDQWLERQANSIETGARMLAGVGTPVFFERSRQVYGEPTEPLRYIPANSLELAQSVRDVIDQLARIDLGVAPTAHLSAEDVAREIEAAVGRHFAEDAPEVTLVGASHAFAKNHHIAITYFVDRLPSKAGRATRIAATALTAFTFLLLTILAARMAWDEYRFEVTSPGLGIPTWIYTIWLPILSLAITGRALGVIVRMRRGED